VRIRGRRLLLGPAAVLVLLLAAVPAWATFNRVATTTQSAVTSNTLQPPTGLTVTCNGGGTATITWTASTSSYKTGYTLTWTGTPAGSQTPAATATTASAALTRGNAYVFTLKTTFKNWTSVAATFNLTC
jgi:hypothetical protein